MTIIVSLCMLICFFITKEHHFLYASGIFAVAYGLESISLQISKIVNMFNGVKVKKEITVKDTNNNT